MTKLGQSIRIMAHYPSFWAKVKIWNQLKHILIILQPSYYTSSDLSQYMARVRLQLAMKH